jgi:hypothetical protein
MSNFYVELSEPERTDLAVGEPERDSSRSIEREIKWRATSMASA